MGKKVLLLIGIALAFILASHLMVSAATLFSADFQTGTAPGWSTSSGTWSVVSDDSYVYKQASTSATCYSYAGTSWTNYTVQANVKILAFNGSNRTAGILARFSSTSNFYALTLSNANTLTLSKRVSGSNTVLASKSFTVATGTWYTLALSVNGNQLSAAVNGIQQLSATDSALASGKIGLTMTNTSAEFDNVLVTDGSPQPTPTNTVTPTPTSTATLRPTPTTSAIFTPTPTPLPTPTTPGTPLPTGAMIGYAVYGNTTGGAGGPTVTVTNANDFKTYVGSHSPYIIQVQGTIDLGGSQATVRENKTIIGLGNNATIIGGLKISHYNNLIVRNLTIRNCNNDGLTIQDCRNVWVDHCTFIDNADGQLDIVHASDWVTVSWCKFYYTRDNEHNFVNLIGHDDDNGAEDTGTLHVTFHHNWWSTLCKERMPSIRYGRVHLFNNYFSAEGNNYCTRIRLNAEALVESNYYENVKNPWEQYVTSVGGTPGKIRAIYNYEVNTTRYVSPTPDKDGNQSFLIPGTDSVFTPPYPYTAETASNVKARVMAGAGPQ